MGPGPGSPVASAFGEGFAYEHEHEIFCEHAALLSGFEERRIPPVRHLPGWRVSPVPNFEGPFSPALARQRHWPCGRDAAVRRTDALPPPDGRARLLPPGPALPREQPEMPCLQGLSPLLPQQWPPAGSVAHQGPAPATAPITGGWPGALAQGTDGGRQPGRRREGRGIWVHALQRAWEALLLVGLDEGSGEGGPCPCTGPTARCSQGGQPPYRPRGGSLPGQPMFKQGVCRPGAQLSPAGKGLLVAQPVVRVASRWTGGPGRPRPRGTAPCWPLPGQERAQRAL